MKFLMKCILGFFYCFREAIRLRRLKQDDLDETADRYGIW